MKDLYTYILLEAKTNGINNSISSSSGEDEILVAFAINKAKGLGPKDDKKALESLTSDTKKVKHLLELYKANKEKIDNTGKKLAKQLGDIKKPFRKLKENEVKIREGNKGKGTPKTDLVSGSGKNCISLSLKKANGPSSMTQFFSGKPKDIESTFDSCKSYIDNEDDYEELMGILNDWPSYTPDDTNETKKEKSKKNTEKTEIVNKIFSKYPKFRQAVFREAITGANKFEDGSPAVAKHVLVWDFDNPKNCHVQNALDFADMTSVEYTESGVKVGIRAKTHKGEGKSALRMEDNNNKHNYSYHSPENGETPNDEIEWSSEIKIGDKTYKNAEECMKERVGVYRGKQIVKDNKSKKEEPKKDEEGNVLKSEKIEDPKTGKKVKVVTHTGPRGGKFYWPEGSPKDDKHRVYIQK